MLENILFYFRTLKQKIEILAKIIKLEYSKEINVKNLNKSKAKIFSIKKTLRNPKRMFNVLIGKEFNIPYIEIVLTTFCNLKCQGCSALMNLYTNSMHLDLNDIIRALKRIIDSVDSIYTLRLLGGEPMCYPYLYDILCFLSKQDKVKNVVIVTNGTLTIKDNRLIEILKNDKFDFSISNYGEASRNFNQLINQLEENNIKYTPMRETYEWLDYGDLSNRNRSEKQLQSQYNKCRCKRRNLLNGKLFQCYRGSHATNLNLIPLKSEDYINLFDEKIENKDLRKKLYKFVYHYTKYIEACNYCDLIKKPKKIVRGAQPLQNESITMQ